MKDKMHVHHVIWREHSGSDLPENLVTLCNSCHNKVHIKPKIDKKVKELFEGIQKQYVHTTILNSIMPEFLEWLQKEFKNVEVTYGYETKNKRRELNLPKTHSIDAYLISLGNNVATYQSL
ncbi:MAG: HNH endonuclease [Desulfobacterales bacterium]|nr:HNH endonuclease [Desulfobacterales bacterium]